MKTNMTTGEAQVRCEDKHDNRCNTMPFRVEWKRNLQYIYDVLFVCYSKL